MPPRGILIRPANKRELSFLTGPAKHLEQFGEVSWLQGRCLHINYVFSIALLDDYSIEVTLTGTMYDDNNPPNFQTQYTLPPFNVPMGGTWSGWTNMENSNGYHNGPANFTFSVVNNHVVNNQQTG